MVKGKVRDWDFGDLVSCSNFLIYFYALRQINVSKATRKNMLPTTSRAISYAWVRRGWLFHLKCIRVAKTAPNWLYNKNNQLHMCYSEIQKMPIIFYDLVIYPSGSHIYPCHHGFNHMKVKDFKATVTPVYVHRTTVYSKICHLSRDTLS